LRTLVCHIQEVTQDEGVGEQRAESATAVKLKRRHTGENHVLYSYPNIIRVIKSGRMRSVRHVACKGARRGANRTVVRKPKVKGPLGRPIYKFESQIKMAVS
jgi:hypothetical protein